MSLCSFVKRTNNAATVTATADNLTNSMDTSTLSSPQSSTQTNKINQTLHSNDTILLNTTNEAISATANNCSKTNLNMNTTVNASQATKNLLNTTQSSSNTILSTPVISTNFTNLSNNDKQILTLVSNNSIPSLNGIKSLNYKDHYYGSISIKQGNEMTSTPIFLNNNNSQMHLDNQLQRTPFSSNSNNSFNSSTSSFTPQQQQIISMTSHQIQHQSNKNMLPNQIQTSANLANTNGNSIQHFMLNTKNRINLANINRPASGDPTLHYLVKKTSPINKTIVIVSKPTQVVTQACLNGNEVQATSTLNLGQQTVDINNNFINNNDNNKIINNYINNMTKPITLLPIKSLNGANGNPFFTTTSPENLLALNQPIQIKNLNHEQVIMMNGVGLQYNQSYLKEQKTNTNEDNQSIRDLNHFNDETIFMNEVPTAYETVEISTATVEINSTEENLLSPKASSSSPPSSPIPPPLELSSSQLLSALSKEEESQEHKIRKHEQEVANNPDELTSNLMNRSIKNAISSSRKKKDVTRCICGMDHDDGFMICCDKCLVWQHIACTDVNRKKIPEKFYCEKCEPRSTNMVKAKLVQNKYLKNLKKTKKDESTDKDTNQNDTNKEILISNENKENGQLLENTSKNANEGQSSLLNSKAPKKLRNKAKTIREQFETKTPDSIDLVSSQASQQEDSSNKLINHSNQNDSSFKTIKRNLYTDQFIKFQIRLNEASINDVQVKAQVNKRGFLKDTVKLDCLKLVNCKISCNDLNFKLENDFKEDMSYHNIVINQDVEKNTIIGEYIGKVMFVDEFLSSIDTNKNKFAVFYELKLNTNEISTTKLPQSILSSSSSSFSEVPIVSKICIDSTNFGNLTRFIHKSCNSNCTLKHVIDTNGNLHFLIETKFDIPKGSEITLPYFNFEIDFNDFTKYEVDSINNLNSLLLSKETFMYFNCNCNEKNVNNLKKCSLNCELIKYADNIQHKTSNLELKVDDDMSKLNSKKEPLVSTPQKKIKKEDKNTTSNDNLSNNSSQSSPSSKTNQINKISEDPLTGKSNESCESNKKQYTSTPVKQNNKLKEILNDNEIHSQAKASKEPSSLKKNNKTPATNNSNTISNSNITNKFNNENMNKSLSREDRKLMSYMKVIEKLERQGQRKKELKEQKEQKEAAAAAAVAEASSASQIEEKTSNSEPKQKPSISKSFKSNTKNLEQQQADQEIASITEKSFSKENSSKSVSGSDLVSSQESSKPQIKSPDYSFVNLSIQPRQTLHLLQRNLSSPSFSTSISKQVANLQYSISIDTTNAKESFHSNSINSTVISPQPSLQANLFNPKKRWLKCSAINGFEEAYSNNNSVSNDSENDNEVSKTPPPYLQSFQSSQPPKKRRHMFQQLEEEIISLEPKKDNNTEESEVQSSISNSNLKEEINLNEDFVSIKIEKTYTTPSCFISPVNSQLNYYMSTTPSAILTPPYSSLNNSQIEESSSSTSVDTITAAEAAALEAQRRKKVSLAEYRQRKETKPFDVSPSLAFSTTVDNQVLDFKQTTFINPDKLLNKRIAISDDKELFSKHDQLIHTEQSTPFELFDEEDNSLIEKESTLKNYDQLDNTKSKSKLAKLLNDMIINRKKSENSNQEKVTLSIFDKLSGKRVFEEREQKLKDSLKTQICFTSTSNLEFSPDKILQRDEQTNSKLILVKEENDSTSLISQLTSPNISNNELTTQVVENLGEKPTLCFDSNQSIEIKENDNKNEVFQNSDKQCLASYKKTQSRSSSSSSISSLASNKSSIIDVESDKESKNSISSNSDVNGIRKNINNENKNYRLDQSDQQSNLMKISYDNNFREEEDVEIEEGEETYSDYLASLEKEKIENDLKKSSNTLERRNSAREAILERSSYPSESIKTSNRKIYKTKDYLNINTGNNGKASNYYYESDKESRNYHHESKDSFIKRKIRSRSRSRSRTKSRLNSSDRLKSSINKSAQHSLGYQSSTNYKNKNNTNDSHRHSAKSSSLEKRKSLTTGIDNQLINEMKRRKLDEMMDEYRKELNESCNKTKSKQKSKLIHKRARTTSRSPSRSKSLSSRHDSQVKADISDNEVRHKKEYSSDMRYSSHRKRNQSHSPPLIQSLVCLKQGEESRKSSSKSTDCNQNDVHVTSKSNTRKYDSNDLRSGKSDKYKNDHQIFSSSKTHSRYDYYTNNKSFDRNNSVGKSKPLPKFDLRYHLNKKTQNLQ